MYEEPENTTQESIPSTPQPVTEVERIPENERKAIYYNLVEEHDKVIGQDPPPDNPEEQLNAIDEAMCSKYEITWDELEAISNEGYQKNWPVP